MSTKIQPIKRSKNAWQNEQAAFEDVVATSKLSAKALKPAHTESHFVWVTEARKGEESRFPIFEYDKSEFEQAAATVDAMEMLETFEGNLRPLHTDTHWCFTKVRA